MSDLPSYEQLNANFDWAIAERELGYRPGDVINIGWMCSAWDWHRSWRCSGKTIRATRSASRITIFVSIPTPSPIS